MSMGVILLTDDLGGVFVRANQVKARESGVGQGLSQSLIIIRGCVRNKSNKKNKRTRKRGVITCTWDDMASHVGLRVCISRNEINNNRNCTLLCIFSWPSQTANFEPKFSLRQLPIYLFSSFSPFRSWLGVARVDFSRNSL